MRDRFETKYAIDPSIGFDETTLLLNDHHHSIVPSSLNDMSIAGGTPFGLVHGWFVAGTLVGYAGQDPFDTGSGFYAKASAMVGKQVGQDSYLIFALDYDGNRTYFQDLPLPSAEFKSNWSPTLSYTIAHCSTP